MMHGNQNESSLTMARLLTMLLYQTTTMEASKVLKADATFLTGIVLTLSLSHLPASPFSLNPSLPIQFNPLPFFCPAQVLCNPYTC